MMHLTIDAPTEFEQRQAYGRHGRRHGLKNMRPNRVLQSEPAYVRGYLQGQFLRITAQVFVVAGFCFAAGVVYATL